MKLLGFAVGASFAAAVGVLFAAKQVFINPESFTFMESIGVLAMVILGGMLRPRPYPARVGRTNGEV